MWSHALRRAGWSDDQSVWTGSCPCQPFSAAGQKKGFNDERHLWPAWHRLIRECRPPVVFGEQVASALEWVDLVSNDLEGEGYAFGAADLCAAGFGGAHLRQRLYFVGVADTQHQGPQGQRGLSRLAKEAAQGHRANAGRYRSPGSNDGYDWVEYSGKKYPVRPGTFPMADAPSARVGRLRAYGNALDAETATQFCGAIREALSDLRESSQEPYDLTIRDLVA